MSRMDEMLNRAPDVRVEEFRQRLRQSLIDSHGRRTRPRGRSVAALAAAALLCMLSLSVIIAFVAEPAYAVRLNSIVFGGAGVAGVDGERPQAQPASRQGAWASAFDSDRRLLQRMAVLGAEGGDRQYEAAGAPAKEWEAWDRYTVSRVRLQDGSTVQILTELPARAKGRGKVY